MQISFLDQRCVFIHSVLFCYIFWSNLSNSVSIAACYPRQRLFQSLKQTFLVLSLKTNRLRISYA